MAFKKHIPMLIEEKQTREKSELFSFSDRKEKLKKYFEKLIFTQLIAHLKNLVSIRLKVKLNLNLSINLFLETSNLTIQLVQQHGQNNLTNLPYTF